MSLLHLMSTPILCVAAVLAMPWAAEASLQERMGPEGQLERADSAFHAGDPEAALELALGAVDAGSNPYHASGGPPPTH